MRNVLILLMTVLVVIACAFLPQVLLNFYSQPELHLDYQQVSISSENAQDYVWRMQQIAEYYFGEAEQLLTTYIREDVPGAEGSENSRQIFAELEQLVQSGVMPQNVWERLENCQDYHIRSYYLFNTETVNGFRIAEVLASGEGWHVSLCVDVESGKIAKLDYGSYNLIASPYAYPDGFTSWYDVLRGYADYLGLSDSVIPVSRELQTENHSRQYSENITADKLAAGLASGGSDWMEVRVLREQYQVTVAVYDCGK